MRITSGTLSLAAQHERVQTSSVDERLRAWVGREPRREQDAPAERVSLSVEARVALVSAAASQERATRAREALAQAGPKPVASGGGGGDGGEETLKLGSREQLNLLILQKTFGVKLEVVRQSGGEEAQVSAEAVQQAAAAARAAPSAGFGVEYDRVEVRTDSESLRVQAAGQVQTADGRDLTIGWALEQTRETVQRDEVHLRLGDAKKVDPLALDLDGNGVRLDAAKMAFDLNADGATEQVARLAGADAWLALDRNGNGRVDDGSELFGPTSGSGFGELAALDGDADGFLDEDDAAFSQLRLWRPGADGAPGSLTTLEQENVGAIGLAAVDSPFELQGGSTRQTGVYLKESGGAGAVQHVDLEV